MNTKKLIVTLLIVSIIFSAVSIILNLSFSMNFKSLEAAKSSASAGSQILEGKNAGNVNLVVENTPSQDNNGGLNGNR